MARLPPADDAGRPHAAVVGRRVRRRDDRLRVLAAVLAVVHDAVPDGLLDTISVVVRHTLIQLRTPDEMRGCVQAINGVFIGASNELGGAIRRRGASIREENDPAFGPTVSVVGGGIGTIVIVALTAWLSPGYGDTINCIRHRGHPPEPALSTPGSP